MSIISGRVDIGIGATVQNLLAGEIFEFLRRNSTVKAGFVAEFGINAPGDMRATFQIGDAVVVQNAPVTYERALGSGILANEDLKFVDLGLAGQRLTLSATNNGAAAQEIEFYVLIV